MIFNGQLYLKDPADVVCVFVDVESKRARVKLSKPEPHEFCCDLASGQALLKYLAEEEAKTAKK